MSRASAGRTLHHVGVLAILFGATAVSALAVLWAWRRDYGLADWSTPRFAALIAILLASVVVGASTALERLGAWRAGRWTRASGAPFRVTFYVLVLGAALVVAAFQPFHKYGLLLNLGVQAGVLSLSLLLVLRRPGLAPRGVARALDRALLVLCATALAVEGGFRAAGALSAAPIFAYGRLRPEETLERHRFEPGQVFLGTACDSRGFHDVPCDRGPGGRFVSSIGDSFSIGIVPHYHHYTTVAERILGDVEIDNLGVNACGPLEYNVLLETQALPRDPDLVLYAVFVGNDVLDAAHFRPDHRWARWFYDREFLLTLRVWERWRRLAKERAEGNLADPSWLDEQLVEPAPEALARRFPWTLDPRLETPSFSAEGFLEIEAARARVICDPESTDAYEGFFDALTRALEIAGGTPLAVLLIPDEFQVEDALWEAVLGHRAVRPPIDRDLPQQRIRAWLEARAVPHLDLLPRLRAVPPLGDGNRHLYALRDTHFNTRGNLVAGENLAQFLATLLD